MIEALIEIANTNDTELENLFKEFQENILIFLKIIIRFN